MSDVYTWLVTGSSRGLGLEFVRQLVASPSNIVIATCRNPESATTLSSLDPARPGALHIVKLDVNDPASIESIHDTVASIVGDQGLDYLVNNAAIVSFHYTAFDFSAETFTETFQSNILGPALLARTLAPLIEKSKRKTIINLTSGLGSIGLTNGPSNLTYSTSKAAINMIQAAARPDFICLTIDPGWCKTDMGGDGAVLEPSESISSILKLVTNATTEQSGKFFRYDGKELPW
ncbi:sniffer [Panus rudis PR-1116 ss-1]|nr:sniffer [Panus rudis PR-1116 ss-1]